MSNVNQSGGKLPVPPESAQFRVQKELSRGTNNTSSQQLDPSLKPLTFIEETFIREYMKDFQFARASRRAGLDQRNARVLLQQANVRRYMDQVQRARSNELEIEQKHIVKFLYDVVMADLSDVIEHYRGACRHCYGHDPKNPSVITHDYQYRSKRERMASREKWKQKYAGKEDAPLFPNGGLGYDQSRMPNPDCPECNGDGISHVLVKDTNVGGSARRLVQSINVNASGNVELRMHDKLRAVELLMRHLGMLNKDTQVTNLDVNINGGLAQQIATLAGATLADIEKQIAADAQRKIDES